MFEAAASAEHNSYNPGSTCVEIREVERREAAASVEHGGHVRSLGGVQRAQALNTGELVAPLEPIFHSQRLDAVVYDLDRRELFAPVLVLEGAGLVLDAGDHLGHRIALEHVACGGHFCPIVQLRGAAAVSVIVDDGKGSLPSLFRVVRVRFSSGENVRIILQSTATTRCFGLPR